MKHLYSVVFSLLLCGCSQVQQPASEGASNSFYNTSVNTTTNSDGQKGDAIYTHSTNRGTLYHHENFSFSYSEKDEQSEWVGYELTREETKGKQQRKSGFDEDPIVTTESSHPYEYRESGYTKGHLAPSGDMKFSTTAMNDCFYTSNISPQKQKLNAGIWNDLEMQVRFWAQKFGTVYVITGPVLKDSDPKMVYTNNRGIQERSNVTIPEKFYKIVYDFSFTGKEKMIGFVIPQEGARGSYFDYAVTVDEIEKMTGIDFFQNIPKKEQDSLEGSLNLEAWKKFTFVNKYNN